MNNDLDFDFVPVYEPSRETKLYINKRLNAATMRGFLIAMLTVVLLVGGVSYKVYDNLKTSFETMTISEKKVFNNQYKTTFRFIKKYVF